MVKFFPKGEIVKSQLEIMRDFYGDIEIDKYVIIPNHIPFDADICFSKPLLKSGKISAFISSFKRFSNKKCGNNIWQSRSYDHIIRDERDYLKIWQYIDNNPAKWSEDCFYVDE